MDTKILNTKKEKKERKEKKKRDKMIKKIAEKAKKDNEAKKDKLDKKGIEGKKERLEVESDVQLNAIYKSIKQNFIFYIVLISCIYSFTKCEYKKSSLVLGWISICFITFYGYVMHYLSHYMKTMMSDIYETYDNIFTRNKYIDWIARKVIYFTEFHDTTHHDTEVNKKFPNIALEFLNNLATQGGVLIIVKYLLSFIDNRVVLLWAFFYATVHNINYNIIKPETHREHHIDNHTNYGIDIWDIIVGSKYDWNNIETHNHTAINLIIITAIIMYLSKRFKL
jgi:hypothetical protein